MIKAFTSGLLCGFFFVLIAAIPAPAQEKAPRNNRPCQFTWGLLFEYNSGTDNDADNIEQEISRLPDKVAVFVREELAHPQVMYLAVWTTTAPCKQTRIKVIVRAIGWPWREKDLTP